MPVLQEYLRAANIVSYYSELNSVNETNYIGESIFPVKKQNSLTATMLNGEQGYPKLLRASAYDADVTLRDRPRLQAGTENLLFFREGMTLKEVDRRRLFEVESTGNETLIQAEVATIIRDRANLIDGARARAELMRMELLGTGQIQLNDNGVIKTLDYGIGENQRINATTTWSVADSATPLSDLRAAALSGRMKKNRGVMSRKTYNDLSASQQVRDQFSLNGMHLLSDDAVLDIIEKYTGVRIAVVEEYYENLDGEFVTMFPDDTVTLFTSNIVGETLFAPTPEEYDFIIDKVVPTDGIDIELYQNSIAVLTQYINKTPVQLLTSVSMNALPTLNAAGGLVILSTVQGA